MSGPGPRAEAGARAHASALAQTIAFAEVLAQPADRLLSLVVARTLDNPCLVVGFAIDDGEAPPARRPPPFDMLGGGGIDADRLADTGGSLHAHVAAQIGLLVRDRAHFRVAEAWFQALEPTGWVAATVEEVAREAGCTPDVALHVLGLLQQAEPAGVFARSLRDCLELQLSAAEALSPAMAANTANLPLLAEGRLADLADAAGTTTAALPELVGRLRRLNPKPGAAFGWGPVPLRAPDLVLRHEPATGWEVRRETWLHPHLATATAEGRQAARAAKEATGLVQALDRRDRIVTEVARTMFDLQADFMLGKRETPDVVTLAQVARILDLHETTVGRVRQHLVIGIGQRTLRLRDLFQAGIATTGGSQASVADLKARIARLLADDGALTDGRVAALLTEQGIRIARRTVAKYRAALGIPDARNRAQD